MIHIIMCTYNAQRHLKEQLESIERNSISEWTLHIFDDRSDDHTLQVISDFSIQHPALRIQVLKNRENLGAWKNFLVAVKCVANNMDADDYIMLCDQDDVWLSNKIEVTLREMKKQEEYWGRELPLLVSTDVTLVDEDLNVIADSFARRCHFNTSKVDLAHALMENHVQGCTMMINAHLARSIKEIPAWVDMHDGWISLVALSLGGHITYLKEQTMLYRNFVDSVTGNKDSFWDDIKRKSTELDRQRKIVLSFIPMYRELIRIYGQEMSEYAKRVIEAYIGLQTNGFFRRRIDIIRYGMWKSGILKNIGLLVLM